MRNYAKMFTAPNGGPTNKLRGGLRMNTEIPSTAQDHKEIMEIMHYVYCLSDEDRLNFLCRLQEIERREFAQE